MGERLLEWKKNTQRCCGEEIPLWAGAACSRLLLNRALAFYVIPPLSDATLCAVLMPAILFNSKDVSKMQLCNFLIVHPSRHFHGLVFALSPAPLNGASTALAPGQEQGNLCLHDQSTFYTSRPCCRPDILHLQALTEPVRWSQSHVQTLFYFIIWRFGAVSFR